MLGGRGSSITDSGAGNVNRVTLGKLGLPDRPKVVEHFWPRRQAATADDACEHRPKVLIGTAVAIDDIQGSLRRQLEGFFQVGAQFRENRHPALAPVLVVFRLGSMNAEP